MNTEIRLAAELVYNKELRFWPRDRALYDRYEDGMPDGHLDLREIIEIMGPIAFCNALAVIYDAGLSFSGCLSAMDLAIRKKVDWLREKETSDEEVQA